jgi:putative colanic acid biosynthesis acetyltransferase WcaF
VLFERCRIEPKGMRIMNDQVQDLRSFTVPPEFRGRPAWYVQVWWLVQATLFGMSPQFMYAWRNWLLRLFGASIGVGVHVRPSARITYPWKVSIGDWSWVGDGAVIYSLESIIIGRNVSISQRCYLCAGSHDYTKRNFPYVLDAAKTRIVVEDEAWLANDVFVGPGVTVGRGAVVGARSNAFNSLPPMMVCYGSPAEAKKKRASSADPQK